MPNMRGQRRFPRVLLLSLALALLTLPPCRVAAGSKMSPGRGRRRDAEARGAHHRPLTDEQKADQNLQFMLSLYRSAAGPGGRPKQRRKFGSNTVRLLRPSASSVHYLPASGGEEHGEWRDLCQEAFCSFSQELPLVGMLKKIDMLS